MADTIQAPRSGYYTTIHFSTRFPVTETPCGKRGPAADRWGYVICIECLERAPSDPRIKARLAGLLEEIRRRAEAA